jgi:ribonuclease BN (tRNA processing enzyme)
MTSFRMLGFLLVLVVAIASWVATCGAWQLQQVAEGIAPLDDRSFRRLTVVTVGTGGPYENPARGGPATVVGLDASLVLVDAGRGVAEGLRASRIPVRQITTVLLTSLMPANSVGLDDLLLTGWRQGRSVPLRVVGPPGTAALTGALVAAHVQGIEAGLSGLGLPVDGARFEPVEISDGWSETQGGLSIRSGALPGGPIDALAYRFEADDRSVVVAGTGWAPDALVEFSRSANLLVHEAVFIPDPELASQMGLEVAPLEREATLHTALDAVGALARRAGVETLALVRLRPPPVYDVQVTSVVEETFDGQVIIANDADELIP